MTTKKRTKTKARKTVRNRALEFRAAKTGRTSSAPVATDDPRAVEFTHGPHVGLRPVPSPQASAQAEAFDRGVKFARANPPPPKSIVAQLDETRAEHKSALIALEYKIRLQAQAVQDASVARERVETVCRKLNYLEECFRNGER